MARKDVLELRKYYLLIIRWAARILASLLVILVVVIFVGESFFYPGDGPPNPLEQPIEVQLEFAGMLAMWVGMIVGWRWEGIASLLIFGGMAVFHIIEGKLWINGTFGLFDLAGILFLLCWGLKKFEKKNIGAGESLCNKCE